MASSLPTVPAWARPRLRPLAVPASPQLDANGRPTGHDRAAADPRALLRRLAALGPRAAGVSAALLLTMVVGLLGFRAVYGDRIYPAVQVADVSLGGLDQGEARAALDARATTLEEGTIAFTYGGQVFTPTLAELGATVDVDAALDGAYALGREDDPRTRLRATGNLLREDQTLPLPIRLDDATLDAWFTSVDAQLGIRPHDAYLQVKGTDVSIVPEEEGVVVDRAAARARVLAALGSLVPIAEELPVTFIVPAVRTGDLAPARSVATAALAKPVKVSFGDQSWDLEPAELAPFIVQGVVPEKTGADAVTVGLDQEKLAAWLSERYAGQVYEDPVDATVAWDGTGGVVALTDSSVGYELKPKAFAAAVAESVLGDHRTVKIPVNEINPQVDSDNLGALGITTEIARGDSNYIGSSPQRATNIDVGATLLNGTLVPPHGEFSFNGAIGAITEDKGYVEAAVLVGERVGRDIGGGICQISTTIFRAALQGGLPITEWTPHTSRLENYERDGWGPGYDASILQWGDDPSTWSDFRFENPSDSWMLIESWADGAYAIVKIYGADLGYEVKFSETGQGAPIPPAADLEIVNPNLEPGTVQHTEAPTPGLEVWFTREVYDRNGEELYTRKFYTHFPAHGNVYYVSPDMEGQSGAQSE